LIALGIICAAGGSLTNTAGVELDTNSAGGSSADAPPVVLEHVQMYFGNRCVLNDLSCQFPRGQISVILGGSGSGKSTILRLIGGLIRPKSGRVLIDGQNITDLSERRLYQVRRKLGMLFQGGALLDSYTVFNNLALPLREQSHLTANEISDEVHATLAAVGVSEADRLLPRQLSGGMLRRVALARAILRKPSILLCDEPFSGLDPVSIKRIEALLVKINRQSGMTMIIVSHHIPSTLRMAERILLLINGKAIAGSPQELLQSTDPDVIDFLNEGPELKPEPERSIQTGH
jgi:phospholipid/cholesterol/gamma-HCH transport system ATP-binding protein